jgi:hypothetical protein
MKGFSQPKKRTGVLRAFCLRAVRDWVGLHGGVANVTLKLLSQIILRVERALDVSEGSSKLLLALRADGNHRRHAEPLRNPKIACRL